MNKVANRQVICEVLCEKAQMDQDIVVLCSDSRGSASLAPFAKAFPGQFVETGIAEQDLVGIAAGLARNGKKAFQQQVEILIRKKTEKNGTLKIRTGTELSSYLSKQYPIQTMK